MKKIFYLLFIIIPVFTFAQVEIGGAIQQTNPADNYPTHYDSTQFGGFRVLADTFKRNAIKTSYREIGMTVYCTAQNQTYQLIGGVTNNFWVVAGAVAGLSASDTLFSNYKVATYSQIYKTLIGSAYVIHVDSASGNDITGNGLIGTPYRSLYKAILAISQTVIIKSAAPITIQLGAGTYNYNFDCDVALQKLNYIVDSANTSNSNNCVQILGAWTVIDATTVFTQDTTDLFKFTASGSPSWTTNQYRNYFAKVSASSYQPIDSNSTNTIWIPRTNTTSFTGISKLASKIKLSNAQIINASIRFNSVELIASGQQVQIGQVVGNSFAIAPKISSVSLIHCYFHGSTARYLFILNSYFSSYGCTYEFNYASNTEATTNLIIRNVIGIYNFYGTCVRNINTANGRKNGSGIVIQQGSCPIAFYNGLIIRGVRFGITSYGNFSISTSIAGESKYSMMVDNCYILYNFPGIASTYTGNIINYTQQGTIGLTRCSYLIHMDENIPIMTSKIRYVGKITSVYDPTTTIKTFIDPSNNRYVLVDSQDVSVNSDVTAPNKISVTNGVNIQPSLLTGDNYTFRTISTQPQGIPYSYFKIGQWNKAWLSASIGGWLYMGDKDFTSNYTAYDSTGKFKNYGTALTWGDIVIPGSSFRVGGSAPTFAAYKGGLYLYSFAVNNEVHFSFEIPHDYAESTNIKFHIHWLLPGLESGTKSVKWELVESHGVVGSAYSPISTNSVEVSSSTNYPDISILSNIVTLSGAGITIGTTYVCRIKRITAAGTAPGTDPMIVSIGVHYQQNTNGSFNETSK